MSEHIFSHIEIEKSSSSGNLQIYLKATGDILASYIDHREGLRTAGVVDKALCKWELISRRTGEAISIISTDG